MSPATEGDYLRRALDVAIRLTAVAILVVGAFRIFSPFLLTVLWAIVIAITANPFYQRIKRVVGGRAKLACAIFIVVSLSVVLVPTLLLSNSLLDATVHVVQKAQAGTLVVPPPTEKVKDWPLIGGKAYAFWHGASADLEGTIEKLQPQVRNLGEKIVSGVSSLGGALVQTLLALIIAGIMMVNAEGGSQTARSAARRLAGDTGPPMVDMTIGTVRSVVKGVVLVAMIQGLLAAVGLAIAGVPGLGLWTLLVMVLGVMQLPPILILGPIIAWVFATNDSTAIAVFFTIWSLLVSASDGFLKPLLLGRGVPVPMLVILFGAIGGMLRAGLIGLFIGPVVLAIFYQLFTAWMLEARQGTEEGTASGATA
jgi:predicted PurR-regulated permease PerM